MLNESSIREFRARLRGGLIEPQDEAYARAIKVYNGMIAKHPRMIAMCTDVADVIHCVTFARNNELLVSIRGGGHNAGGLGICDDGLVIDLSMIRYTHINPELMTVTAGGGALLGDVDHATHIFGLATPLGIASTTGVAGLTLGGGLGYLTRKFGLSIDNLLSVGMVLADGTYVTANADHHPDLFWAVRGGGGNFGVVTSFTFKLHDVNKVYGGPMLWDLNEASEILKWYRHFIPKASDDLNGFFAFMTVPPDPHFPEQLHLKKMCAIVWACTSPAEVAEELFKSIREFKKPTLDLTGIIPLPVLQSLFDSLLVPGMQWYWKADFINELSDEAIHEHIRFAETMPTPLSTMHLYPIDGAAARIDREDTAWNYRDAKWAMIIAGIDPDVRNNDKIISWAKEYFEAVHPYSAGGAYINFIMDEGEDRVKTSYGKNYDRLVTVKNKYDPNNLFRVNQNIKPTVSG